MPQLLKIWYLFIVVSVSCILTNCHKLRGSKNLALHFDVNYLPALYDSMNEQPLLANNPGHAEKFLVWYRTYGWSHLNERFIHSYIPQIQYLDCKANVAKFKKNIQGLELDYFNTLPGENYEIRNEQELFEYFRKTGQIDYVYRFTEPYPICENLWILDFRICDTYSSNCREYFSTFKFENGKIKIFELIEMPATIE
jgi:hypothetical protein